MSVLTSDLFPTDRSNIDPDVDVRVYLVNLHKSGDIAIFKRHEEFSTDPPLSVRLDQLHISNTDKQEPIFTTGYCGSDFFLHPRGRATRFDHLLQNYKNSCSQHLKTLPENLRIGQLRLQTTVVSYHHHFVCYQVF